MPRASDYTISDTDSHEICIARRLRGGRCTRIVGRANEVKVESYKTEINDVHDVEIRLILARQLVLHSCCLKDHRSSLIQNSDLLDQVAHRWLEFHVAEEVEEVEAEEKKEDRKTVSYHERDVTSDIKQPAATKDTITIVERSVRSSRRLRGLEPLPQEPQGEFVVPYGVTCVETLEDAMRKDAKKSPRKGYVYCLSGVPDHVKIGYSATSVEKRLADWRKCQPEAKLLFSCEIGWPRKVERFVHLELHQHRRKLARECDGHQTVHRELFETSIEVVERVFQAWLDLLAMQPLYSEEGLLEPIWITWLKKIDGEVSAEALLEVCRKERSTARRHERRFAREIDDNPKTRSTPSMSFSDSRSLDSENEVTADQASESLEEMRMQLRRWTSMVSRLQKSISLAEQNSCASKQALRPAKTVLRLMI